MLTLDTPIERLPKIQKRIVSPLKRLGIHSVRDLLFYFPARYDDFSHRIAIREIKGVMHEPITIQGTIKKISNFRTAQKRMALTEVMIADDTGSIKALWFNQPYLSKNLKAGDIVNFSGKIALGPKGLYMQNPAYEKNRNFESIHTGGFVPVYPETEGITSRWLRFLIKSNLLLSQKLVDPLPPETLRRHLLLPIQNAIRMIHFPKTLKDADQAKKRFGFEKILFLQLKALHDRSILKKHSAPHIKLDIQLIKQFVESLPFSLTNAQRRSLWEIMQDMARPQPMNRLLEGDVGSGKTVIAAASSLLAVRAGYLVAFMAPTEILARQHYTTLNQLLAPFGVTVGLFVGSEKKNILKANIIVGTHALIQKKAKFENVGLVIVDEQHRFGVEQRAALVRHDSKLKKENSPLPHFLSMSATPIPRTLVLAIYGDLDLSLLDEMPKSRKEIITQIVFPGEREKIYQFIREEIKKGRQAFIICPKIESTVKNLDARKEKPSQQALILAEVRAVKEEYKKLSEKIFPDLRIGMLHGKMKSQEKKSVMEKFRGGRIDLLVSTSVVEVGVDISNATIMVIEGAERFGLSQLHQFRGRVGRGAHQSYCFLFPTVDGAETRRLRAMVHAKNGFELAEKDLEIRGPGEIFGLRQSGIPDIGIELLRDHELIRRARQEAIDLIQQSPDLDRYQGLLSALKSMEKTLHLE